MAIKVGTCGYSDYRPPGDWKKKYDNKLQAFSDAFAAVELNRSFYQLPMVKTARRWRSQVAADFEFTIKAWQAITHSTDSPTWRKRRDKLTEKQKSYFGDFRPNSAVMAAWAETAERARALAARVCVLQSPPSFNCTRANEKNLRRFADKIDRRGIELAWEPRGDWNQEPERIAAICRSLGLIHIVDLLRRDPLSDNPTAYIRLHGLNENEYDVKYAYSHDELERLAAKLKRLATDHDRVYCMFNNIEMYANAASLRSML
jgi:uncharacterized protein YecE (DUF72 family)